MEAKSWLNAPHCALLRNFALHCVSLRLAVRKETTRFYLWSREVRRMPANRTTDPHGLTIKRRAFVHAYCGDARGNGLLAAKMAGYKGSDATLRNEAYKLLKNEKVAQAIRDFGAKVEAKGVSSALERQGLLDDIIWGRVSDVVVSKEGAPVKVPANLMVRLAANRDLARMRCEMGEKREIDLKGVASVSFVFEDNGRGPPPPPPAPKG